MHNRSRIVAGSLLGAVAIHLVFLACSSSPPPSDAGRDADRDAGPFDALMDVVHGDGSMEDLVDAVRDSLGELVDGETRDARADDGGTCTCTPPYDSSFSLTFDRGHGPETPRPDYSTGSASVTPVLQDGQAALMLVGASTFYTADGTVRYSTSCYITIAATTRALVPGASNQCSVTWWEQVDGGGLTRVATAPPTSVTVSVLEDTRVEFSVPSFTVTFATGGSVTMSNIVFRATSPGSHFLTPPRQYRP